MNVALRTPWTLERFLAWEDRQEGRHEFDGERIREVTGGSRAHNKIVTNLVRAFEDLIDPGMFDVIQEMRVETHGQVRYPDVSVVSPPVGNTVRTLRDAVVLFEVLSPDTADVDRHDKLAVYAGLASIRRYVILEQDRPAGTDFLRVGGAWSMQPILADLTLPELDVVLPLAAIYRGIFPA